jgi:FtsP/CotA-like multicopper oxidase with cupredoxin domain/Cu/Ag efflux protein CusF
VTARLLALVVLAGLGAASLASLTHADDPPPADQVPLYDRYKSTQAYRHGGQVELDAFDAERNRVAGADDDAVSVEDRSDGTRNVTIRLEIIEVQQEVYPGKRVLFWVYAPLGAAMTSPARMPSPTIRVEEGDHVRIVLYNTHYFPHTIHFHGVTAPFSMDGAPDFSQVAVAPGHQFSYEFVASNPGTYWYHCHVDPSVHVQMGLAGMFIIEPKRPDNHFARVVIGAGRISSMAKATAETYQGEYSLVYQDVDERLNRIALAYTDAREIEMRMHRDYDSTQRKADIFLLNGYSSPYSLLDTPILVKSGQVTKLRILDVGGDPIYFHTHGHHPILTDVDGDPLPEGQQYSRDTFEVGPAQRIDLALHTGEDGRYAAGPGVWMVHDHAPSAESNAGIDGGAMTAIVYDGFMGADGLPRTAASLAPMFDPNMYTGAMPTFDPKIFGSDVAHYAQGWPADAPLGGAFDYPRRHDSDAGLPQLDLIDVHRHRPVAHPCAARPRGEQLVHIMAGTRYARPGEVYAFEPRQIHLGRCMAVTVVVENTDEVRHDFMIPGLNPMVVINVMGPGSAQASFVTPDQDVTLLFHCHVSTHERHGMLGMLIVGKGSRLDPVEADGIVLTRSAAGSSLRIARGSDAAAVAGAADAMNMPAMMPVADSASRRLQGTAAVVSIMPGKRQIVVDGDAIPGYMAAMTMLYKVASPQLLAGLKPQDRISLTVDVSSNTVVAIKVLRAAP